MIFWRIRVPGKFSNSYTDVSNEGASPDGTDSVINSDSAAFAFFLVNIKIKSNGIKKGITGILYLTRVPKLKEINPTIGENTRENISIKIITG